MINYYNLFKTIHEFIAGIETLWTKKTSLNIIYINKHTYHQRFKYIQYSLGVCCFCIYWTLHFVLRQNDSSNCNQVLLLGVIRPFYIAGTFCSLRYHGSFRILISMSFRYFRLVTWQKPSCWTRLCVERVKKFWSVWFNCRRSTFVLLVCISP